MNVAGNPATESHIDWNESIRVDRALLPLIKSKGAARVAKRQSVHRQVAQTKWLNEKERIQLSVERERERLNYGRSTGRDRYGAR